jgi:FAD/FMN-containing dehydrogenase
MNRVIEFSEETQRFTAESGMRVSDCIAYLQKRGYMFLETPTTNKISSFGARAGVNGFNKFNLRWGPSSTNITGIEVVIPNGDVLTLGKGSSRPTKSIMGYNLADLFIGSRGTLGVITKVTERIIRTPPAYNYSLMAFKTLKDGIEAYIDLKRAAAQIGPIWRVKSRNKWVLKKVLKGTTGLDWPEDVEQLTVYHILGEKDVVEATEKHVLDIMKSHNGFWRDDFPAKSTILSLFDSGEKYMGMSALGTDRSKSGGLSPRFVPFDASIPDGNYVEFFGEMAEHWHRMEDAKVYPNLSERMQVQDPGGPAAVDEGYSKNWALAVASYTPPWTEEARLEFYDWFRKYAEICWKYGGVLSSTHGYIPRALEVEILKKELGENYYKLMLQIKNLIDPKHILNPQTKFRF